MVTQINKYKNITTIAVSRETAMVVTGSTNVGLRYHRSYCFRFAKTVWVNIRMMVVNVARETYPFHKLIFTEFENFTLCGILVNYVDNSIKLSTFFPQIVDNCDGEKKIVSRETFFYTKLFACKKFV